MSFVLRKLSQLLVVGIVVAFGQMLVAHAAPEAAPSQIEVLYDVTYPDPSDPKQAEDVPIIKATVIGAPNQPMEKFTLIDKSAKPTPIEIKATKLTPFLKSNDEVAVAIVMNGWEMWIGNDKEVPQIREDDPSRYPGVLVELRNA